MPQYEYRSIEDGEIITLLRPMREADAPVDDPAGQGRTFERIHSIFGTPGKAAGGSSQRQSNGASAGGCCPCGKPHGRCG